MDEKKEELSLQEWHDKMKTRFAATEAFAELVLLKGKMFEEIKRLKGCPKDNHLDHALYKNVRKLVSNYEEHLYKYRENFKKSQDNDYFFTDRAQEHLKEIRQAFFMDEYEKELETSSEYRELIEEYEEACAELEKSNDDLKELPDGILTADEMEGADTDAIYHSLAAVTNHVVDALAPVTRWENALTKLTEYEVKYKINAIVDDVVLDMQKEWEEKELNKANDLTQQENTLEKTDNDDTILSSPKTAEKADAEKETPKLIIPTQEEEKTNSKCVVGLISGVLSMFFYWILPILLPVLAVIISGVGLSEISKTGEKGKGMAIWGLILGIIYTIQSFIKIAFIGSL